jgi:RNA polymerase sigma-70 factor (ECF subfamily)
LPEFLRIDYPFAVPPTDTETTHWFVEHLQPHESSLRAYLRSSLSSASDVDDIVQDTYTRILKMREATNLRSGKALLFAVARNAVRDLIRHRAVVHHVPITETPGSPVLQDKADVVEFVSHQQELALLAEAIHTLPTRCREVLLLRKIQGLSQKEIASRFGISENTVETLVAKGTRRCRDYLRELGVRTPSSS